MSERTSFMWLKNFKMLFQKILKNGTFPPCRIFYLEDFWPLVIKTDLGLMTVNLPL